MVRPSVILSVRYRNHFPVVQFQNQAHIWNPRGTDHVFKTIWGARGTSIFFYHRPQWGAPGAPNSYYCLSPPPKAAASQMGGSGAPTGAPRAPKGGARDATPTEGEGNPTEGGYFASLTNQYYA